MHGRINFPEGKKKKIEKTQSLVKTAFYVKELIIYKLAACMNVETCKLEMEADLARRVL
jgi:hypothetical protein